jgi:hypothetical protein
MTVKEKVARIPFKCCHTCHLINQNFQLVSRVANIRINFSSTYYPLQHFTQLSPSAAAQERAYRAVPITTVFRINFFY